VPQVIPAIVAFAGTTVGAFALQLGGSLLLSAVSSKLARKDVAKATMQGRTVSVRSPAASRRIVYGRARAGGTIVYIESRAGADKDDGILDLVIVLAGRPVRTIGAVYFDGEMALDAAGVAQGRYAGLATVQKQYGTETSSAFSALIAASSRKVGSKWTAEHRMQGCAAIHVSLTTSPDVYPSGIPNISVDIEGRNDIFDPRTGTTGYSENPALCLANYMADARFGLGAGIGSGDGIESAALIAAANICDETVAKVGGGTEPRYACNGILDTQVAPKANIEGLLTAMAGTCAWQAGQWQIYAGAYRIPSLSLTADDVVGNGLQMTTRQSRASNFNAVRGTFVAPENDWQEDDFPAYVSSAYVAEDGGETVWRDIILPYTISASMAQRLAKIEVERNRRQLTVFMDGKLRCWQAAVGDTVALTYPRWGLSSKPFEVSSMALGLEGGDGGPALTSQLALRETAPGVYDWATSEAQIYAAAPRTTLPSAFDVAAPGGLSVSESLYQTLNGSGVKARVLLSWIASLSSSVSQYQVETSFAGGPWVIQGRTSDTTMELLDFGPGNWSFRVKAISILGVASPYSAIDREILGLSAPPVALANVTLQSAGGLAILEWALSSDLDVLVGGQIVIRHSAAAIPTWANSVSMKTVPGNTALAVMPLKPGTYLVRPVDASGEQGPVSAIATAGIQVMPFAPVTTLQEDAAFTGAKSQTILETGVLRLNGSGNVDAVANFDAIVNVDGLGGVFLSGTYDFAAGMNFGSVKRVRLRSLIDLTVLGILDNVDTRPLTVDDWLNFDGVDGGEVDCVVEYRTTQTNPSGSPVWSGWRRVDNTEDSAWGVQARALLSTNDPGFSPAISQLRLIAEEAI
jgi:hypothetical protein